MPEVGRMLREARERKGVSLEEVEQELKIRQKFLSALESDQPDGVLEDIYVKGFLQNYARYLGLDAARVLRLYTGEAEPPVSPAPPAPVAPPPDPVSLPPLVANLENKPRTSLRPVLISVLAVVIVVGLVAAAMNLTRGATALSPAKATAVWALTHVVEPAKKASNPTTPSPSPSVQATPTLTPTATSTATATPTITLTPTPSAYTGVDIELVVSSRAWLQVNVDGQKAYEGILESGARRNWHANDRVEVRCGNAGGVEAIVNGQAVGRLGELGQVVDMEWQKEQNAVPTDTPEPTMTPLTSTEALSATATAVGTATAIPSVTETPPATPTP